MLSRSKPLTPRRAWLMMSAVIAAAMAGIRTPNRKGVKAPHHGVFLCPTFSHGLGFAVFIMVGCSGQPQGWPVPFPGSSNPLHPAAQSLEPLRVGLSHSEKDKSL